MTLPSSALACLVLLAQGADEEPRLHPRVLVEQEAAFCDACKEDGIREGFLRFMAADSVLFRPHAVSGREWLRRSPATEGELTWYPATGFLAAGGDLGFTTGPYVLRGAGGQEGHGQYASIWRRGEEGWRAVLDHGIQHGPPVSPAARWQPGPAPGDQPGSGVAGGTTDQAPEDPVSSLHEADDDLTTLLLDDGPEVAFELLGHTELRVLRMGMEPVHGLEAAMRVPAHPLRPDFQRQGSGHSAGGDLGYTYGKLEVEDRDVAGNSVRIWTRDSTGEWRLLLYLVDLAAT